MDGAPAMSGVSMKRPPSGKPKPVNVLLSCPDHMLADLVSRNLDRREYMVHQVGHTVRGDYSTPVGMAFDLVIADADDEGLEAWERAVRLRTRFPYLPLVILAHGVPGSAHCEQLQPYRLVRKPFAIDELLSACTVALSVATA
jgi:DNA-binding response OmpR family regulator